MVIDCNRGLESSEAGNYVHMGFWLSTPLRKQQWRDEEFSELIRESLQQAAEFLAVVQTNLTTAATKPDYPLQIAVKTLVQLIHSKPDYQVSQQPDMAFVELLGLVQIIRSHLLTAQPPTVDQADLDRVADFFEILSRVDSDESNKQDDVFFRGSWPYLPWQSLTNA